MSATVNVMQATLTRSGDYAVRAVLDIAGHAHSGRRKRREIAAAMNVPAQYLSQILAKLVRAQILTASAGPDGGYELTRPAAQVNLFDVVVAIEGEVRIVQCVLRGIPCSSDGICAVHDAWSAAQHAMAEHLRKTTFADLVKRDRELRAQSN